MLILTVKEFNKSGWDYKSNSDDSIIGYFGIFEEEILANNASIISFQKLLSAN